MFSPKLNNLGNDFLLMLMLMKAASSYRYAVEGGSAYDGEGEIFA